MRKQSLSNENLKYIKWEKWKKLSLTSILTGVVIIDVSIYHGERVLRHSTGQQGHIASLKEDPQPLVINPLIFSLNWLVFS